MKTVDRLLLVAVVLLLAAHLGIDVTREPAAPSAEPLAVRIVEVDRALPVDLIHVNAFAGPIQIEDPITVEVSETPLPVILWPQ